MYKRYRLNSAYEKKECRANTLGMPLFVFTVYSKEYKKYEICYTMTHHLKNVFNFYFLYLRLPPLIFCTASFIGGICWEYNRHSPIEILIFLSLIIAGYKSKIITKKLIPVLLIVFVLAAMIIRKKEQKFEEFYLSYNKKKCSIRGIIDEIRSSHVPHYQSKIILNVKMIRDQSTHKWFPLNKKVEIYLPGMPACEISDFIEISNVRIKKTTNKSFIKHLLRNNIYASLFLKNQEFLVLSHPQYSFKRWIDISRKNFYHRLKTRFSPQTYILFSTIFLGNREFNKKSINPIKEQFKKWGISHHLARSGLHLVIFLILLELLLKLIPIHFSIKQILAISLVLIYHLLTFATISFIRALAALLFIKTCILYNVRINILHIIALICLLILFFNPYHLFFLDFQLSFALTFALAWLNQLQITRNALKKGNC